MLSKILLKSIIKNLLLKLDFSIQYSNDSILIFDDALSGKVSFNTIFKDASQTEAFGKMLEDLINNAPENPFLNDNEDDEKTN
jgi:hypothetical protein